MLSAAVRASVEEVGFEGPPGISWPDLCERLRARGIAADSHFRKLLWPALTSRSPHIVVRDQEGKELTQGQGRKIPEPDVDVSDAVVTLKPARRRRDPQPTVLLDVHREARLQLLHLTSHPQLYENQNSLRALQAIARHRYEGCWAPVVAKTLNVTSKDLFYHLEGLRLASLVFSVHGIMPHSLFSKLKEEGAVCQVSSVHSNVYFHTRFYDPVAIEAKQMDLLLDIEAAPLAERIMKTLEANAHGVAFERDLRVFATQAVQQHGVIEITSGRAASKLFLRVRQSLCEQQKIECVSIWDQVGRSFRDALCLYGAHPEQHDARPQLALKDQAAAQDVAEGAPLDAAAVCDNAAESDDGDDDSCDETGGVLVREGSRLLQTLDLIEVASCQQPDSSDCVWPRGITGPEVGEIFGLGRKACERILDELVKHGSVVRVLESDGRKHVNRYIHKDHAEAVCGPGGRDPEIGSVHQTPKGRVRGRAGAPAVSGQGPPMKRQRKGPLRGQCAVYTPTGRKRRYDVTFQRRLVAATELLEERGVLTPVCLQKAVEHDPRLKSGGTLMDRHTAVRIFEVLVAGDERARAVRDDAGMMRFLYWRPTHTLQAANERMQEEEDRRRQVRTFKAKVRRYSGQSAPPAAGANVVPALGAPSQPLALTNFPAAASTGETAATEAHAFPPGRRRLTTVAGARFGELCKVKSPTKEDRSALHGRRSQRVLVFYGFQAPVMARVQILHRFLLDNLGLEGGAMWSAVEVVNNLSLQVFLQIIGSGLRSDYIDTALVSEGPMPRVQDLPPDVHEELVDRTYAGASRAVIALRRLMTHLIDLGLAKAHALESSEHSGGAGVAVSLRYSLCRIAEVCSFVQSHREEPALQGTFDFAGPLDFEAYWKELQRACEVWIRRNTTATERSRATPAAQSEASGDDDFDDVDEDLYAAPQKRRRGDSVCPLPANGPHAELFCKKNWIRRPVVTPTQRATLGGFIRALYASAGSAQCENSRTSAAEPSLALALPTPPRVLTPQSPEVLRLSRQIGIAAERVVKYCMQHPDVAQNQDAASRPPVRFSLLSAWRFCCHLCGYLCFQKSAIWDHYEIVHGIQVPADIGVSHDPNIEETLQADDDETALAVTAVPRRRNRRKKIAAEEDQLEDGRDEKDHFSTALVPIEPVKRSMVDTESSDSGFESATDAEFAWEEAFLLAEAMVSQRTGRRPHHEASLSASAPAGSEVWSLLADFTARPTEDCMKHVRTVLAADGNSARYLAGSRQYIQSDGFQPYDDVVTATPFEQQVTPYRAAAGRAMGRVLLLTAFQADEPWWRRGYFSQEVLDLIETPLERFRADGLVCKHKRAFHSGKLPGGSKPKYMLTSYAKTCLFGRAADAMSLSQAQGGMFGRCVGKDAMTFQETDATGPMLMALAELVARDEVTLEPVWPDADFYERAEGQPPPWKKPREVDAEDFVQPEDSEVEHVSFGSESEEGHMRGIDDVRYGGVRAHLMGTSAVPAFTAVTARVHSSPRAPERDDGGFLSWLFSTRYENEPLDPLHHECVDQVSGKDAHDDESPDTDGEAWPTNTVEEAPSEREPEVAASVLQPSLGKEPSDEEARAAFAQYAAFLSEDAGRAIEAQRLLEDAAFLFSQVVEADSFAASSSTQGSERAPRSALVPGSGSAKGVAELWGAFSLARRRPRRRITLRRSESACSGSIAGMRANFEVAVACLEELRLLVPFPSGSDFFEVVGGLAAPFCTNCSASSVSESSKVPDLQGSEVGLRPSGLFARPGVGWHWRCSATPSPERSTLLLLAANCVVRSGCHGVSCVALKRLLLPPGLVAPAAWVDARGHWNLPVLRCILVGLLQHLLQVPGATCLDLADEVERLLEGCEVDVLLQALTAAGVIVAKRHAFSSEATDRNTAATYNERYATTIYFLRHGGLAAAPDATRDGAA